MAEVIAVIALLVAVWAVVRVEAYRKRLLYCEDGYRLGNESGVYRLERERQIRADVKHIDEKVANLESYVDVMSRAPAIESDVPVWGAYVLRTTSGERPEVREIEEGKP